MRSVAPASRHATPAMAAAATLSHIQWAMTKTIMATDKMHSAEAACRMDAS